MRRHLGSLAGIRSATRGANWVRQHIRASQATRTSKWRWGAADDAPEFDGISASAPATSATFPARAEDWVAEMTQRFEERSTALDTRFHDNFECYDPQNEKSAGRVNNTLVNKRTYAVNLGEPSDYITKAGEDDLTAMERHWRCFYKIIHEINTDTQHTAYDVLLSGTLRIKIPANFFTTPVDTTRYYGSQPSKPGSSNPILRILFPITKSNVRFRQDPNASAPPEFIIEFPEDFEVDRTDQAAPPNKLAFYIFSFRSGINFQNYRDDADPNSPNKKAKTLWETRVSHIRQELVEMNGIHIRYTYGKNNRLKPQRLPGHRQVKPNGKIAYWPSDKYSLEQAAIQMLNCHHARVANCRLESMFKHGIVIDAHDPEVGVAGRVRRGPNGERYVTNIGQSVPASFNIHVVRNEIDGTGTGNAISVAAHELFIKRKSHELDEARTKRPSPGFGTSQGVVQQALVVGNVVLGSPYSTDPLDEKLLLRFKKDSTEVPPDEMAVIRTQFIQKLRVPTERDLELYDFDASSSAGIKLDRVIDGHVLLNYIGPKREHSGVIEGIRVENVNDVCVIANQIIAANEPILVVYEGQYCQVIANTIEGWGWWYGNRGAADQDTKTHTALNRRNQFFGPKGLANYSIFARHKRYMQGYWRGLAAIAFYGGGTTTRSTQKHGDVKYNTIISRSHRQFLLQGIAIAVGHSPFNRHGPVDDIETMYNLIHQKGNEPETEFQCHYFTPSHSSGSPELDSPNPVCSGGKYADNAGILVLDNQHTSDNALVVRELLNLDTGAVIVPGHKVRPIFPAESTKVSWTGPVFSLKRLIQINGQSVSIPLVDEILARAQLGRDKKAIPLACKTIDDVDEVSAPKPGC